METERLRQFCAIADCGSLTQAAELLNISLGGLSKSMKVLEEELGFPVLIQAGRGIAVSEQGLAVYAKAKKVLEAVSELRPGSAQKEIFRIGALEVFSVHFVGKVVAEKFKDQKIQIIEASPGELEALLIEHKIDCGITYLPHPHQQIEAIKIASFELRAYAAHRFSKTSFEQIPFIVPASGLSAHPLGIKERDGWPYELVPRLDFHRVNMLSTALALAREGLGAVYMPDFVAKLHNETQLEKFRLVPVAVPNKAARVKKDAYLLKRNHAEETSEMKKIASAMRILLK